MMEIDPPDDLTEDEKEVWERGAKAGIEWLQMLVMSIDFDEQSDITSLEQAMESDDESCPRCGGELEYALGEPAECSECGYTES